MNIDYENSVMYWWVLWNEARLEKDKVTMNRAEKELHRLGVKVSLARRQPALCTA